MQLISCVENIDQWLLRHEGWKNPQVSPCEIPLQRDRNWDPLQNSMEMLMISSPTESKGIYFAEYSFPLILCVHVCLWNWTFWESETKFCIQFSKISAIWKWN